MEREGVSKGERGGRKREGGRERSVSKMYFIMHN